MCRRFNSVSSHHAHHCAARGERANCALAAVKTLHAYLTRQVVASLVMTVVVFTFVLLLGNVLKDILKLLVNGQATLGVAAQAVGLLIPFVWAFALPMAMLTATLLVFGRFSADHELTAARAGGLSLLSLITPILLLSLFLCGVSALVNLEIAPRCRVAYKNMLDRVMAELVNVQLPEDRYIKDSSGNIFYVGRNRNQLLENVMVFLQENDTYIRAARGRLEWDGANKQYVIRLFNAGGLTTGGGQVRPVSGDIEIPLNLGAAAKGSGKPPISDMTFSQLQDALGDLERSLSRPIGATNLPPQRLRERQGELQKQREDWTSRIRFQIQREVAFSFACFGFTLVGIPLGIQVHRRETSAGVAIALVLVLVYYSFIVIGQSLATQPQWGPQFIVWLPNFIFQAVGAVLLWRANRGV